MLDYAIQLQSEEQFVTLERVNAYITALIAITDSKQRLIEESLESAISFSSGQYELAEQGKLALAEIVGEIMTHKNENFSQYPDKSVTIKVKVVGYTDESGFREGTPLIRELIEGFEQNVPPGGAERRKFLNQRLSTLRAKTIGEYIQQQILESEARDSHVSIKQEIVGKGEEIPPGINPPYAMNDPRRRICKVYSYVIAR